MSEIEEMYYFACIDIEEMYFFDRFEIEEMYITVKICRRKQYYDVFQKKSI